MGLLAALLDAHVLVALSGIGLAAVRAVVLPAVLVVSNPLGSIDRNCCNEMARLSLRLLCVKKTRDRIKLQPPVRQHIGRTLVGVPFPTEPPRETMHPPSQPKEAPPALVAQNIRRCDIEKPLFAMSMPLPMVKT